MNDVVHWVKAFVTKPGALSLIPEISTVEQENQLPKLASVGIHTNK